MWEFRLRFAPVQQSEHPWGRQWQLPHRLAYGARHRAADRRADSQDRHLARALGAERPHRWCALVEIGNDRNHVLRQRQTIGLEVVLRDAAVGGNRHLLM
jgi:hypothetical protein